MAQVGQGSDPNRTGYTSEGLFGSTPADSDGSAAAHRGRTVRLLLMALVLLAPRPAGAYTVGTVYTIPCHERITLEARRRARALLPEEVRLPPQTRDDRALLNDLPFETPESGDLASATLVLGDRYVDLLGYDSNDTTVMVEVAANPATQQNHCLRRPSDDGDEGDLQALEACRQAIGLKLDAALAGLGPDGHVDPTSRVQQRLYLQLRGEVDVALPTLYFRLGEALHTLQDAFSHNYRIADHHEVIAVMNAVEMSEAAFDPAIDGPPHSTELDQCKKLDAFRARRLEVARQASTELMVAMLDTSLNEAERRSAAEAVLDAYLTYHPGCNAANRWCDAPERAYRTYGTCGCHSAANRGQSGWLFLSLVLLVLASRRARKPAVPAAALGALLTAPPALGSSIQAAAASELTASSPMPVDTSPITRDKQPFPLGLSAMGAIGVQHSALAFSLGLRWRLDPHVLVGVDGEYNPFFSFRFANHAQPGVWNTYGTFILRFPLDYQRVNLRTTLNCGVSTLLFDVVGAPRGGTGLFFGGNLLGLDIELTSSLYLVIDPAYIAYPVPILSGTPYAYPQYRLAVGVQWGA